MPARRPASPIRPASRWASPCSTTTCDGWPDLFVANDTQPNKLYRNNKNGTFTEEGMAAGVAFGEDGVARGAMGVDAADYDRSGRPHLLVGNFSNQMLGLYHNEGNGLFVDEAPRSPVGRASLLSLAFGVFFFDYDLDGLLDIFAANGHIEEEIGRVQPKVQYKQPPLLFRNAGKGKFENASTAVGSQFNRPIVARGAAYGDFDRDGDLDVLITTNHGPAYLFRNDGGNATTGISIRTARRQVEPRRHRRRRAGRRAPPASSGAWCAAARATARRATGADLRPGQGHAGDRDRDRVAERAEGAAHQRPANQLIVVKKAKASSPPPGGRLGDAMKAPRGAAWLAVDWGTTNVRAWLVDGVRVLRRREFALGVGHLQPGEAARHFRDTIRPAIDARQSPAILCGMIGSTLGWEVAPYVDCPVDFRALHEGLHRVRAAEPPAWIVPGLKAQRPTGGPDVMRGEETQLFGWALGDRSRCAGEHLVCLPGTHTKWIRLVDGRIGSFVTVMTGELFALLRNHSVLRAGPAQDDETAFALGLEAAGNGSALASRIFTAQ